MSGNKLISVIKLTPIIFILYSTNISCIQEWWEGSKVIIIIITKQ